MRIDFDLQGNFSVWSQDLDPREKELERMLFEIYSIDRGITLALSGDRAVFQKLATFLQKAVEKYKIDAPMISGEDL
jgi:hypothetical protein